MLAALLGLVVGPLADHYGAGRLLMVGVVAATVSTLAIGLAPTYAFLVLVTIIGAIGRAAVQPTAQATVAQHFPDEATRRYAMSCVQMGMSGAAIVGIPLLTFLAALSSWRLAFVTLAVLGFISLLVLWRTLPRTSGPSPDEFGYAVLWCPTCRSSVTGPRSASSSPPSSGTSEHGSSGATWRRI
jgi:predicted MFS family arabinose efflux permease